MVADIESEGEDVTRVYSSLFSEKSWMEKMAPTVADMSDLNDYKNA